MWYNVVSKTECMADWTGVKFVNISGNYVTATISVFALLFLISDVPYNAGDDSFVLMRTSFRGWVLAKTMYVFAFCIIYNLAIIIISLIFAAPFSYLHGLWSEPAVTMSFKDPFLSVMRQHRALKYLMVGWDKKKT